MAQAASHHRIKMMEKRWQPAESAERASWVAGVESSEPPETAAESIRTSDYNNGLSSLATC